MRALPELLVIRHGETAWNREGRMQGRLDSPLTARGVAQARAVGGLLRAQGVTGRSHAALCSPQGRAMRTAKIALAPLGLEARAVPGLGEISVGDWSGLTRAQIEARWPAPAPDEHFLDFYARAPGGDSFEALWARVTAVLAQIEGPTVIVTHGITSRFLRTAALGGTLADLAGVPGGQGVVHRVAAGRHETWAPPALAGAGGAG